MIFCSTSKCFDHGLMNFYRFVLPKGLWYFLSLGCSRQKLIISSPIMSYLTQSHLSSHELFDPKSFEPMLFYWPYVIRILKCSTFSCPIFPMTRLDHRSNYEKLLAIRPPIGLAKSYLIISCTTVAPLDHKPLMFLSPFRIHFPGSFLQNRNIVIRKSSVLHGIDICFL